VPLDARVTLSSARDLPRLIALAAEDERVELDLDALRAWSPERMRNLRTSNVVMPPP
jgi:hypothetical protein